MKKKIGKEIIIGFLITVAANLAGMYFYVSAVTDLEIIEFLKIAIRKGFFSNIIGLGALLDFLPFFVFLKKGQWYRVRGVLLGVIVAAIVMGVFLVWSW